MNLKLSLALLFLLPLVALGCGGNTSRLKTHPVEGTVQFEGRPLEGAFVVLHPKGLSDPKFLPAHAQTDASGNFKATTYDAHDGAIAGEYSITVEYTQLVTTDDGVFAGPNLLPPRYSNRDLTQLTARIAEGSNKLPLINLTR